MEVKDVANYLLNHCYIMGEVEETRDRYYYSINHLEELKKLFRLSALSSQAQNVVLLCDSK